MADRCRRVVGERETTVNPAGKVVTQAPEPLPTRPGSRKLSFVRNQEHFSRPNLVTTPIYRREYLSDLSRRRGQTRCS